jgi:peptidylprolyl isomerase domain and WD repeat-containing protein 1
MSDSPDAPDASVLGKRVRNEAGRIDNDLKACNINSTVEDDSDDDVGPMPMPAQAPAAKKKRRGIA